MEQFQTSTGSVKQKSEVKTRTKLDKQRRKTIQKLSIAGKGNIRVMYTELRNFKLALI